MSFLVRWLLPLVESAGKAGLLDLLQKLHDTHEETYVDLLTHIYPLIDVQLETFTTETKSKIDDVIIEHIKGAIELSAQANGVKLPDLDMDADPPESNFKSTP